MSRMGVEPGWNGACAFVMLTIVRTASEQYSVRESAGPAHLADTGIMVSALTSFSKCRRSRFINSQVLIFILIHSIALPCLRRLVIHIPKQLFESCAILSCLELRIAHTSY